MKIWSIFNAFDFSQFWEYTTIGAKWDSNIILTYAIDLFLLFRCIATMK